MNDAKTWAYEVAESVVEALAQNSMFTFPNDGPHLGAIQAIVQEAIADHWPPPRDP